MAKEPSERFQTCRRSRLICSRSCLAHVQQPLTSPLPPGLETRRTRRGRKALRRPTAALILIALVTAVAAARNHASLTGITLDSGSDVPAQSFAFRPSSASPTRGKPGPRPTRSSRLIDQGRLMAEQTDEDIVFARMRCPAPDSISGAC